MWEPYLDQTARSISNKYRARRLKAKARGELLKEYANAIDEGFSPDSSAREAMCRLGSPRSLSFRLRAPEQRQHGWLWMVSAFESVVGLATMTVSMHSQYLVGIDFGRSISLWGAGATLWNSRQPDPIRRILLAFRKGRGARFRLLGGAIARVTAVGAFSGLFGGLLMIVPWNLINANMMIPVVWSEGLMIAVAIVATLGPWIMRGRLRDQFLATVALQVYAGLAAALTYAGLLWCYPSLVPPPFFNWTVLLTGVVGFSGYFACIRLYRFWMTLVRPKGSSGESEEWDQAM